MLRAFVLAFGVLLLVGAAVLAVVVRGSWPESVELAIFGILVLAGTLFERRYRSRHTAASAAWQTTGERFVDPISGKLVEVRYNATTGERAYIPVE
ncbi:MAG: hypothetical protein ACREM2_02560 [Vulcanimicrobiaceae bacterium]